MSPPSYAIEYSYADASVPPPFHTEFTIRVDDRGHGKLEFRPDYPGPDTPTWTETFVVPPAQRDALHETFRREGILEEEWSVGDRGVGGPQHRLQVTMDERTVTVPPDADAEALADVYESVRSLVPGAVWRDFEDRRRTYSEAYDDGPLD